MKLLLGEYEIQQITKRGDSEWKHIIMTDAGDIVRGKVMTGFINTKKKMRRRFLRVVMAYGRMVFSFQMSHQIR